jgi:hypothetical protein
MSVIENCICSMNADSDAFAWIVSYSQSEPCTNRSPVPTVSLNRSLIAAASRGDRLRGVLQAGRRDAATGEPVARELLRREVAADAIAACAIGDRPIAIPERVYCFSCQIWSGA